MRNAAVTGSASAVTAAAAAASVQKNDGIRMFA